MAGLGDKNQSVAGDRRERTMGGRDLIRALAVAAALVLAGCGWHPLYERPSPDPASGGAGAALAQIAIDPVAPNSNLDPLNGGSTDALFDSRAAQLLQNYLKTALNPYGAPSATVYHLAVEVLQQRRSAVSLGNGETSREDLVMTATYRLNDAKGQSV